MGSAFWHYDAYEFEPYNLTDEEYHAGAHGANTQNT